MDGKLFVCLTVMLLSEKGSIVMSRSSSFIDSCTRLQIWECLALWLPEEVILGINEDDLDIPCPLRMLTVGISFQFSCSSLALWQTNELKVLKKGLKGEHTLCTAEDQLC